MEDLELDVRPILRGGGEPFAAIMNAVRQLEPDQCLRLYATFKPDPLFTVMAAKGFTSTATAIDDGDWMVVFTPAHVVKQSLEEIEAGAPDTWPEPAYFLDCTDPDGPEAHGRVLGRLSTMAPGEVMFALMPYEPVQLFAELRERNAAWAGDSDATGECFRLMIRKSGR